jgi:hypothetical protein
MKAGHRYALSSDSVESNGGMCMTGERIAVGRGSREVLKDKRWVDEWRFHATNPQRGRRVSCLTIVIPPNERDVEIRMALSPCGDCGQRARSPARPRVDYIAKKGDSGGAGALNDGRETLQVCSCGAARNGNSRGPEGSSLAPVSIARAGRSTRVSPSTRTERSVLFIVHGNNMYTWAPELCCSVL